MRQKNITPGQSAVFYRYRDGEILAGIIEWVLA